MGQPEMRYASSFDSSTRFIHEETKPVKIFEIDNCSISAMAVVKKCGTTAVNIRNGLTAPKK